MRHPAKPQKTKRHSYGCAYDSVQSVVDFCKANSLDMSAVTFDYENEAYCEDRQMVVEYYLPNDDYEKELAQYNKDMEVWEQERAQMLRDELAKLQTKLDNLN